MLVPVDRPSEQATSPGKRRGLCIVGSTGSIGCSSLEIVRKHPERFQIVALCAGRNVASFMGQVAEFAPRYAVLGDDSVETRQAVREFARKPEISSRLGSEPGGTEFLFGTEALCDVVCAPEVDVVVAAVVGFAGLSSTVAALKAGKFVALANKESLVCAGELISRIQKESGAVLVPVDSEHSALFQALQGERPRDIDTLILTASGGPFLRRSAGSLDSVTVEEALKHPRWKMGAKITIDSATMVNKALEVIEAAWLFAIEPGRIEVIIHPQSIVHSLVNFRDGVQMAQLSVTDMQGPIAYALNYPYGRLDRVLARLDLAEFGKLEFEPFCNERFPAVGLARAALSTGGVAPAVFNMANEIAVGEFLRGALPFSRIVPRIEDVLGRFPGCRAYESVDDLAALQSEVKESFFS